jgi:hypothetical protein
MIERYSDHAANERTHLAWVRTAIAIMALGFLVQKFDLFLRVAASSLAARPLTPRSQIVGDIAGLLLIERAAFCGGFAVYREWAASRPGTVKVRASRADASRPWVATQGRALLAEPVKTSDFGYYKGGKAQRRARKIADRVDRGRASFETAAFAASSG